METAKHDYEQFDNYDDVGIHHYLNDNTPILNGVVKHRYSDFVVNEIDPEGTIATISRETDVVKEIEILEKSKEENKKEEGDPSEQGPKKIQVTEEAKAVISEVLPEEGDRLLEHIRKINEGLCERTEELALDHIEDKERRTKVHHLFRNHISDFDTYTKQIDGEKKIMVLLKSSISKNKRKKLKMQSDKEEFPHIKVVMYKESIESMQAIFNFSKLVKKQAKYFGIAGNKDKRGITFQNVTISFGNLGNIKRAQTNPQWIRKIKIGNIQKVKKLIKLGDLSGNRFSLAIRFIEGVTDEEIKQNVENISTNGFLNYFGMQRFGCFNIMTHTIGKEAIKQNWKEVIRMMLSQYPRSGVGKDRKESIARLALEDEDLDEALKLVQPRDRLEKVIILTLKKHKNGFRNAFDSIARNTRIIYIHAYQSYIWNKVTSTRFEKFGTQVLVGDLVSSTFDNTEEIYEDNDKDKDYNKNIKFVTEENIKDFTIFDVVMPMIGKSIQLPENEDLKKLYLEYMEEDGITIEMFKSKSMEGGCSHGAYRHIISKAKDIEYDTVEFADKDQDLLNPFYITDGKELEVPAPVEDEEKFRALRIKFSLPPSSYATIFVRELTHQ
ncbi:unnamed protein product [Moneuplotes crassus]|uniref:TRUD domain-containing protein n=1 Tax=Euplotes crassus TaxID=5936 RepID=A0AAD1X5E0_EUPCR|nr:unnamed protein product [Moneuplotes crassus]